MPLEVFPLVTDLEPSGTLSHERNSSIVTVKLLSRRFT